MDFILDALFYVVPFLLLLTLVVTVHELGHFLMARGLGVAVDRFSLGFGRPLLSWRDRSGVEWRVGWLPLGGYVRFAGDANDASTPAPSATQRFQAGRSAVQPATLAGGEGYFHLSPVWKRALVVAAGPAANFLLSITLFALLLGVLGSTVVVPRVASVEANSPAARAGFRAGDLVTALDGRAIEDFGDLAQYVQLRAGQAIRIGVRRLQPGRADAELEIVATPERRLRPDPVGGQVQVGVLGLHGPSAPSDFLHRAYGPRAAVAIGVQRTADIVDTTLVYVGRMLRGRESGDQLGGPLRIARVSGALAKAEAHAKTTVVGRLEGEVAALLTLAAVLSVGIGFMNLLPVPVLDGGHLVFYAYEAIARKPLGAKFQALGYRVGFGLLMGLVLFATWNDLQQLSLFKFLGGLVH